MKKRTSSIIFCWAILLGALCYSGLALAAAFKIPPTDISISYLLRLFGPIGGLPVPTTGTISTTLSLLGVVFRDLNYGILTIATLILSYTTVRVIVDTAHDGEPMGKKISHWIVARTAVGIGLLVPKATGYTMLQAGTIWMVVQGVGLADVIWQDVLDYLNKGGVLYETGVQTTATTTAGGYSSAVSGDLVTGGNGVIDGSSDGDPSMDVYAGAMTFLRAQVCMKLLGQAIKQDADSLKNNLEVGGVKRDEKNFGLFSLLDQLSNAPNSFKYSINPNDQTVSFPGPVLISLTSGPGDTIVSQPLTGFTGICGKFRWGWNANPEQGSLGSDTLYMANKFAGVQAMLSGTGALADSIVNGKIANPAGSPIQDLFYEYSKTNQTTEGDIPIPVEAVYKEMGGLNQSTRDQLISLAAQYQGVINDLRNAKGRQYKSDAELSEDFKKVFQDASAKGWASAGEYYYSLTGKAKNQTVDQNYYRVWSGFDAILTEQNSIVQDLRPAPRAGSSQKDTIYSTYSQIFAAGTITPFIGIKPDGTKVLVYTSQGKYFLISRLNTALRWSAYLIEKDIRPYLSDMNRLLEQANIGTNLDLYSSPEMAQLFSSLAGEKQVDALVSLPTVPIVTGIDTVGSWLKLAGSYIPWGLGNWLFGSIMPSVEPIFAPSQEVVRGPLRICVRDVIQAWVNLMAGLPITVDKYVAPQQTHYSPVQKLYLLGGVVLDSVWKCWTSILNNAVQAFWITVLSNMGISLASTVWTGIVSTIGGIVAIFNFGVSQIVTAIGNGLSQILSILIDAVWKIVAFNMLIYLPMALGVTAILFTLGVTLYFYIPLLPYLLFSFGVISWLIFVIEAITASAVVALGLMDPRAGGDEIWGRAEPAQMLWLSVFLRPSTMLVGLLTGTILTYIAMLLINVTFLGFLNTIGIAKSSLPIANLGVMFAYVLIMVNMIAKCYECIYAIPDQIMQWVGAHTRPSTDMQMLHELKQGFSQVAGETAGVAKAMGEKGGAAVEGAYHPHGR